MTDEQTYQVRKLHTDILCAARGCDANFTPGDALAAVAHVAGVTPSEALNMIVSRHTGS